MIGFYSESDGAHVICCQIERIPIYTLKSDLESTDLMALLVSKDIRVMIRVVVLRHWLHAIAAGMRFQ